VKLEAVVGDVLDALVAIDTLRPPFKGFQPGVGPYGEPQLLKLVAEHLNWQGPERRAVVVIGYEYTPAIIDLDPLVESFEAIVRKVARIQLSHRVERRGDGLVHPVHQTVRVFGWEVLGPRA
jgi:hypothetical protein